MAAAPGVAAHKMHFHRDFPWKEPVRVATTTAGTLASSFANGSSVDGVTLATGDRILVKNQAAGAENGLYTVNVSGAPTRAYDMDANTEVLGALIFVIAGGQAGTFWNCTNAAAVTLGSTALTFAEITAGALGALAVLTDVSLASLANADRLRYSTVDSKWHNSALIWRPLTVFDGTNWLPLVDSSGNAIMTEA
jgi:hypothetical protein